MRKVSWWWGLFVVFTLAGCSAMGTVNVPKVDTCPAPITITKTKTIEVKPDVKWPECPAHHLQELTKDLSEDQKLSVIFAANKACINNYEAALKELGVKEPK